MCLAVVPAQVVCKRPDCDATTWLDEEQKKGLEDGQCVMIICDGCGSSSTVCAMDPDAPCAHVEASFGMSAIDLVSVSLETGISAR